MNWLKKEKTNPYKDGREETFGIYILSADDDVDIEEFDFDYIFDNAIDSFKSNNIGELLVHLIRGLNDETISDMNWFFLMDLEHGVLLSDVPNCLVDKHKS